MLTINNLCFSYDQKQILNNLTFSIAQGQNVAILGESGCGKSTLLKLIYGLLDTNQGQITLNDHKLLGPKFNLIPGHDSMKYLAQDFDLMPFTTVTENIGQFLSNVNPQKKAARVLELLQIVEMQDFADTKTRFLSGGQMQRVAIARVLANEPKVLLLDEPFSHIDNFRKNALRRNLFGYLKNQNISCLVATHDSTDALSFSDQTIVIQAGRILQQGESHFIYNNPINKYVGSLFGEINELPKTFFDHNASHDQLLLCYPNQIFVSETGKLKVNVRKSYFKGSHYLIKAVAEKRVVFFEHPRPLLFNQEILLDIQV